MQKLKKAGIAVTLGEVYPAPKGDPEDAATFLPSLSKLEGSPTSQSRVAYFALAERIALCKLWHPQHGTFSSSDIDAPNRLEAESLVRTLDNARAAFEVRAIARAKSGDLGGARKDVRRSIQIIHLSGGELSYLGQMGEVNHFPFQTIAKVLPLFARNPSATEEFCTMLETTPPVDYRTFVRRIAGESLAKDIQTQKEYAAGPHDPRDDRPMRPSLDTEARQWLGFLELLKGDPHNPLEVVRASEQWQKKTQEADDLIYWTLAYDTAEGDIQRTQRIKMVRVAAIALEKHELPIPPKGSLLTVVPTSSGWRLSYPERPNLADRGSYTLGYPSLSFNGQELQGR